VNRALNPKILSRDVSSISRRRFLKQTAAVTVGVACGSGLPDAAAAERRDGPFIQTVRGPIPIAEFGPALIHEHVMCDFIGAEQTGRHRWNVDAVVKRMTPYLKQLKERAVAGFVDCTPAFIARDPRVLKRLAEETGLHIVTNTGYYGGAGDKFVPKHAYDESADQLCARWVREWEKDIEDTGVRPGFVKIGVDEAMGDPPELSEIDAKLVRAAARASRQTGLAVTCHTGGGPAGLAATRLFVGEKGDPARFIVAHSDSHGVHINQQIADLGAWVSFDAISRKPLEEHLKLVNAMVGRHADHLLLSHDNGWYWVGQSGGGEVRDYNYIYDTFVPALKKSGVDQTLVRVLTVDNPGRAFGIRRPG
jgi:phosphotriesterase-related protein